MHLTTDRVTKSRQQHGETRGSMKVWYNNVLASNRYVATISGSRFKVGRGPENDIVLDSPFVADHAVDVRRRDDCWEVMSLGMNGCTVGDHRVALGERFRFNADQPIKVFPFELSLQSPSEDDGNCAADRSDLDDQLGSLVHDIHSDLLALMYASKTQDKEAVREENLKILEEHIEEFAEMRGIDQQNHIGLVTHTAGVCVRSKLVQSLIDQADSGTTTSIQDKCAWNKMPSSAPHLDSALDELVELVAQRLCLASERDLSRQMELIERGFWVVWDSQASQLLTDFRLYLAKRHLKKEIKDIFFGYGPLEDLLRMPMISEIMVVDSDKIFIEKNGVVENSGRRFISDDVTLTIIERIVSKVGRRIDKSQPLVDARLLDGSRVNAIIPPLAISGPSITIRKFPEHRLMMDDLIAIGSITQSAADFLRACVLRRRNILVAGGTGTGKTTLLNCLSDCIPTRERIVTIEDTAELQLAKDHVVRLETKPANMEGSGEYSINDLVRNSLRMRPDRIIVGECRGPEALDMLQAMNTGHDGSLTTIHANSAEDTMLRLEVLVQSGADMPTLSIHRQIVSAIDLVVQLERCRDGVRRVSQITEVVAVDTELGGIRTKDIYRLEGQECQGLRPTGCLPSFMSQLLDGELIQIENFYR